MKKATHKLVNYNTLEVIYKDFTYDEWVEAHWSDGASTHFIITVDGVDYYDYGVVRKKSLHSANCYPFASYAAGVTPGEVPEMQKIDAANEVPTEYNSEGDPVFTDKAHRKKYCEVHNLFDRNAGYSDPVKASSR